MSDEPQVRWKIREAVASDGPAIAHLEGSHPDSGSFGLAWRYKVDALQAQQALRPGSRCVVAESTQGEGVVGMGFVTLGRGRWGSQERTVGMIYGLVVDQNWRRQGIASALYQGLFDLVRQHGGPTAVIMAGVQADNEGSLKAARRWANQAISGRTKVVMATTPRRAPMPPSGLTFRPASAKDWPAIVAGWSACHGHCQLVPPANAEEWSALYAATPFGTPLRSYWVAEDPQGRLVAGLGILFDSQVETGHFLRLPWTIRFMNLFLRVLPQDGVLRRLVAKDLWYLPDHPLGVGGLSGLWTDASWRWRSQGNSLMMFTDQRGPLGDVLPKNPFLPDGGGWVMVHSEPPLDLAQPLWLPM